MTPSSRRERGFAESSSRSLFRLPLSLSVPADLLTSWAFYMEAPLAVRDGSRPVVLLLTVLASLITGEP